MPMIDKLGAALCTVVLGSRKSAWMLYACDPAGPISTQAALDTGSPALDPVYLGEPVVYGPEDAWPDGLPFGPDDDELPTRGHAIILPLYDGTGISGFVALQGIPRPIDEAQLRTLKALTRVFSLSLTNVQLGTEAERLAESSPHDALTDTLNRGAFYERLRAEWRRSARELTSMAIALLDVDYFSRFNDLYGQRSGDRTLQAIAATIAAAGLRSSDFVARYDGDVFAVVLPGTNEEGALALCDRIRSMIAERGMEHSVSPFGVVTASIGVASMRPNSRRVPAALLYEADAALHRAKQAGRNRVAGREEIRTSAPLAARSMLPEHAQPFDGRERELAELAAATDSIVTILGAPGAGKSALALEYARRVPERAVFVDLEHAVASGVVARVARALEIVAYSSGQLATALRDRTIHEPLLIVLDGCDDALDGAISFVEAVHGVEGLRTIVTSRTPLRLRGERVFHIVEPS